MRQSVSSQLCEAVLQDVQAFVQGLRFDGQRREQADDVAGLASGHQQQPGASGCGDQRCQLLRRGLALRRGQFDTPHRANPGQTSKVGRKLVFLPCVVATDDGVFLPFAPGRQILVTHLRQRGQTCSAADWVD